MNKKFILALTVIGLAISVFTLKANTDNTLPTTVPEGSAKEIAIGERMLEATGCGIIRADEAKTTFIIKCGKCGFKDAEETVDTPAEGNAYSQDWICPKCKNQQNVLIRSKKKEIM